MQVLRVRVLGRLELEGLDLARVERRSRRLLGLLALRSGAPTSADALIDALWAEDLPSRPASQLSVLVSRIRSLIGRDRIERTDAGYALCCDWLDLSELSSIEARLGGLALRGDHGDEREPIESAAEAAERVLGLALGDPAVEGSGVEWVESELASVRRALVRVEVLAAEALVDASRWSHAIELAHRALERDPYVERALRVALRAAHASGETAGALAMYATFRERIAEELGASPDGETERLHASLLRGEGAADVTPDPGGLPGPPLEPSPVPASTGRTRDAVLVGRDEELGRLDEAWHAAAGGDTQLVVVRGEPGIGKTSLADRFVAIAASKGSVVWRASCDAVSARVPLQAVVAALRGHAASGDDVAGSLRPTDRRLLDQLLGGPSTADGSQSIREDPIGPSSTFAALGTLVDRLADEAPLVFVIEGVDDLDPASAAWLRTTIDRHLRLLVVATARPGGPLPTPFGVSIDLGPLTLADASRLVPADRLEQLWPRSGGNPLFLLALAGLDASAPLPASVVEIVGRRCDELGDAARTLRTAALISEQVDVDLVAAVTGTGPLAVAHDVEAGVGAGIIDELEGGWAFHHQLVREALADGTSAGTRALVHREVARALHGRPDADPSSIAHHARLGGEIDVAVEALVAGANRAEGRFDHAEAERLLDEAVDLAPGSVPLLARARVRTRRGRYRAAIDDVTAAMSERASAEALEIGAWASYFGRDFDGARRAARDGVLMATDEEWLVRCRMAEGRIDHADGDLRSAESALGDAIAHAHGIDLVVASAWQGVLRSHQGRPREAIDLLSAASRPGHDVAATSATLHALLFLGHAQANLGLPAAALESFERYTTEVERRSAPRFAGRGINFAGWVLRNLGAVAEGVESHHAALGVAESVGSAEVTVAACEDLAEAALVEGDADGCTRWLDRAAESMPGDLVFGWRLAMKLDWLRARAGLCRGDAEEALAIASRLAARAEAVGVPRYAAAARLVGAWAARSAGRTADERAAERDLDVIDQVVRLESWWITAETAGHLGRPDLFARASDRVSALAAASGEHEATLLAYARERLSGLQLPR